MAKKGIAWRKHHERRMQKKRIEKWFSGWSNLEITKERNGYFRKNHFGCGCASCKPHKHGWVSKYVSGRRKRKVVLR